MGEDFIEIKSYLFRIIPSFYGISSCCRAIRRGVLAQCGNAKAERGQPMKKTENQNNVTVDPAILNYANPYFVPIEDGDEETIKH